MNPEELNLETQISELKRLQVRCLTARDRLNQLRIELSQLDVDENNSITQMQSRHETQLRVQVEKIAAEARNRLEQSEIDLAAQRETIRATRERRLHELNAQLNDSLAECRQKLQGELWVLQSVCDETNEDTPVRQAERAHDIFHTQSNYVDQQLSDAEARVQQTAAYLQSCHAGMESAVPPVDLEFKGREASRLTAIEQVDLVLAGAHRLDLQHLPQWILGWRMYGLGLLIFGIVAVISTALRADLTLFVNPEFSKPDWKWLGVSCLIGFGASILIVTVLLAMVQSRLRNGFEEILQHVANAKAASEYWKQKSRQELKRLDQAAETWRADMQKRRELHASRLQAAADARISELTDFNSQQMARQSQLFDEQIAAIDAEAARLQSAILTWRSQELSRVQTQLQSEHDRSLQQLSEETAEQRRTLKTDELATLAQWKSDVAKAQELVSISRSRAAAFPRWSQLRASGWSAPVSLPSILPVGNLLATIPALSTDRDKEHSASLCLELPGILTFPRQTSIAIEHDADGREAALDFVRAILLRLLTSIMPGRVQFTLIDPVGLGQSFSAMMHLADFDELLISNRIWTESIQIRDRLQKVTEHMESVFQTYLRSDFNTIEEYNAAAGEVAEPYHFVVIAGFPAGFTEDAARHLTSILTSGPRCGVHAIVTWTPSQSIPRSFDLNNLRTCCTQFHVSGGTVQPGGVSLTKPIPAKIASQPSDSDFLSPAVVRAQETVHQPEVEFEALASPDASDYVSLVKAVGEKSRDARRVEVSFARIAPKPDAIWSLSSADGIDFPIGRAGAARLQYMRLGRGTSQHVLVAGKTGSGKSTLLHILITNLALYYSPDEIQFYLIDFKKGVEFRTYAANKLPHARVVAIESDREFGLSVLERLDELLQERGELFRVRGVQDVPSFRRQFPGERMPRLLLLIDEFQEFFTSEDRVSSRASLLLDRLIRQGRAFGIHVLLGSQTLGGAYSLARSTLGQVAVRIALQCSESDAHLILSEENSAARLLTRPGEAIYNDANGMVEGNHPFQIAWLDEAKRESMIHELTQRPDYQEKADSRMIVFEGNVPPSVEQCGPLNAWLSSEPDATRHFVDGLPAWIGEPVAIAAPMSLEFRRTGGQNVLIVGQESDLADTILASLIVSWCVGQSTTAKPRTSQMIFLHDGRDRASLATFSETFTRNVAPRLSLRDAGEVDSVVAELWQNLNERESGEAPADSPEVILAVRNIGQFRSLRRDEDDFGMGMGGFGSPKVATPATQFGDLIRKGPSVGIHVIVWSDTFSNAMRWLSNSLLREFDNRIAFRLNQTDSASLIDTPAAASLTQGRAILYRDQTGSADRFRPFSWPSKQWLATHGQPAAPAPSPDLGGFDINELIIE
jgi:energy-coupling factor transporter ATP-binding protein EcfA2